MPNVIYAASRYGYCVQVIEGGEVVYECNEGNHPRESHTVINSCSPYAITLGQLRRWARQTANQIAEERGIPSERVEHDADLEAQLKEQDEQR